MGFVQRRLVKLVMGVVARPRVTLLIAGVVLIAAVAVAMGRLRISTEQNKLFSPRNIHFRDWLEFCAKFPENEAIYVIIEPKVGQGEPAVGRWTSLADRITKRMLAMPAHVEGADCRVPLDKLGTQGILFEDSAKLPKTVEQIKKFVPLVKLWGEEPDALTQLLGTTPMERFISALATQTPDEQTAGFVKLLADSWVTTLQRAEGAPLTPDLGSLDAKDPSHLGYYYVADPSERSRHLMLVRVYGRSDRTSLTGLSQTVESIRQAVREEAGAFPEFTTGVTGRPALAADEMRTTDRDSHRAEVVALSVVFVGLVIFLRSAWLALAAELALAVAIGWTFGFATIAVGELNLLSLVFLIALIGIGMDYLIQILAAYRRETRRYVRPMAIWARVFRYVGPPIVTACLGASAAFLVSVLSDFRGAAELGIIAGGGLVLCLVAGYTVLPAMLVLWPARIEADHAARFRDDRPLPRATHWRLALPLIWIGLLVAGIPFALRTQFNSNLLELQAPNLESVKLVKKLQTWSVVVLSKDLNSLKLARENLKSAGSVESMESIVSAYDNYEWLTAHKNDLPAVEWAKPAAMQVSDLVNIANKATILAGRFEAAGLKDAAVPLRGFAGMLRESKPRVDTARDLRQAAERLSAWQEAFVAQLRELLGQLNPPPPDLAKIPPELRDHLVSADGTLALYVYPKDDVWKQEKLERFVDEVEARAGGDARVVTGIASNIRHTTESIKATFYRSAALALGAIVVLVFIDLRRITQTILAVSVLALGLPMLVALMGLLGVDWNFANFFALPILIGAGHEYGVFMMHRYREVLHDPRRVWRWWDASDRALLLCAFVTSSSFGFFWAMGHHKGLKSLGLVMALGSASIYLATIMVVRPMLLWRISHRGLYAIEPANGRAIEGEDRGR